MTNINIVSNIDDFRKSTLRTFDNLHPELAVEQILKLCKDDVEYQGFACISPYSLEALIYMVKKYKLEATTNILDQTDLFNEHSKQEFKVDDNLEPIYKKFADPMTRIMFEL